MTEENNQMVNAVIFRIDREPRGWGLLEVGIASAIDEQERFYRIFFWPTEERELGTIVRVNTQDSQEYEDFC